MPRKSILLIEYETSLRDVLGGCLSEFGDWQVTPSQFIDEGIRLCEKQRPDVILIDASTAENDALVLVERLKQYSIDQAVPLLLLSSLASWFTHEEFRQMGFSGAIGKPFNPSTLASQISLLVSLSKAEE
jgi:DNA-binding response OmpR family regulator